MTAPATGRESTREVAKAEGGDALVAMIGRPNCGKSSLFNAVTGARAHVGNFPGVTVDVLEADVALPSGVRARIADLPGVYSVEATVDPSTDEGIARAFLDDERVRVVVLILDPLQLRLGLNLARELAARKLPMVVCISQRDVAESQGLRVDVTALRRALGCPVVLVSARDASARGAVLGAIDEALRDGRRADSLSDWTPASLASEAVQDVGNASERRRRARTSTIDKFLLNPWLGPPLFVGLMTTLFALVFLVADPASQAMDAVVSALRGLVTRALGEGAVASFFADGVLGGAGTVVAFMPQIVILTAALELLESSGYLARGAFLVDRVFRALGLGGRSFVPLLMGHACAVPAIAATRIVRDPRERLAAILVLPLTTCSARLPTYALVLATFFAERSALFRASVFVSLYGIGAATALIASFALRKTVVRGRSLPLLMEMPAYRLPQGRVLAQKVWGSAKNFLREVGTVIVGVSAVLWLLLSVPSPGRAAAAGARPIESSVAAAVGQVVEPLTRHAGFDWRINVGLIGSFGAREVMVGTLGVIYGIEGAEDDSAPLADKLRAARRADGTPAYSARTGLSLLAFFVIACQCMSTVAAIRRETKSLKWPAFVVGYTYALAYVAAVATYQVSGLLGIS